MTSAKTRLGDLCDLVQIQVDPRSDGTSLYLGLEHVASGRFTPIGSGSATEVESSKYAFERGDVLYGKLRPYLDKAVLAEAPGICTTELLVLRPKEGVDPRFLACVAHAPGFVEHAIAGTTGAQHPRTSWRHIREFELPSFRKTEQTAIAELIWKLHGALLANERLITAGSELKRTAMKELFTRGLHGEAQKETEIGPVPESWEVIELGAVREWLQYGTSTRCTIERIGYPVLRIPNIERGIVNTDDLKFAALSAEEAAKYRLQRGDLIFIRTNGVIERLGACAVYAGEPAEALFASYLIRARLRLDRVDPFFVAHFLGSELGTGIVAGRATPAADGKYNLNTGTIDGLPIPLPRTLDEQREIVTVLDVIDRKIDLHRRKRSVLNDLFKALLQKLMTGEIRVADLDLAALDARLASESAA